MLSGKETSLLIQIAYCHLLLSESPSKKLCQAALTSRDIPAERDALSRICWVPCAAEGTNMYCLRACPGSVLRVAK